MHMLYAVDLCRTLSVCCESFCMLSLIAVGGLGLFDFFSLFYGVVVADGSVCGLVLFYFFHSFLVLQCFHHWIMWGYQSNPGEAVSLAVLSFATIRIRVVHVCACPIEYVHGTTYVKLYVWFESLPVEMR